MPDGGACAGLIDQKEATMLHTISQLCLSHQLEDDVCTTVKADANLHHAMSTPDPAKQEHYQSTPKMNHHTMQHDMLASTAASSDDEAGREHHAIHEVSLLLLVLLLLSQYYFYNTMKYTTTNTYN
jgi:hypothetical protein